MAPAIIAALIAAVPSIVQMISGAGQKNKANKIESQYPLPLAEIAPSINKQTGYAYGQTLNQDVPGGELYRNEIKGATSAGMTAASELGSGAEAYGMLGQLVGREQNAFSDLAKQNAQQVQGAKSQYLDSLTAKANEENRVWGWNKAQPYLQAAQIASQLRESGAQNLFAGLKTGAGIGSEYFANKDMTQALTEGQGRVGSNNYSLSDADKEYLQNLINNGMNSGSSKSTTGGFASPHYSSLYNQ